MCSVEILCLYSNKCTHPRCAGALQQSDFDMLLVNLRMDAVNVKENMRINWVSEAGIMENIAAIIKEYKDTRNLHVSQARTWVGMIAGACYV